MHVRELSTAAHALIARPVAQSFVSGNSSIAAWCSREPAAIGLGSCQNHLRGWKAETGSSQLCVETGEYGRAYGASKAAATALRTLVAAAAAAAAWLHSSAHPVAHSYTANIISCFTIHVAWPRLVLLQLRRGAWAPAGRMQHRLARPAGRSGTS